MINSPIFYYNYVDITPKFLSNKHDFGIMMGHKNSILVMTFDGHKDNGIAALFRTNDLSNERLGIIWHCRSKDRFAIHNLETSFGSSPTLTAEKFFEWLQANHPEDLHIFLWHPEILQYGIYNA